MRYCAVNIGTADYFPLDGVPWSSTTSTLKLAQLLCSAAAPSLLLLELLPRAINSSIFARLLCSAAAPWSAAA
jgi:hypothetical protein